MNFACNYAVARFLPYAETEEFVNVGVVLHCAATGYLDFRLAKKWSRVTEFFPELDAELYRDALRLFRVDLQHGRAMAGSDDSRQLVIAEAPAEDTAMFRELVRPRESLFRFGKARTVLTNNPQVKLEELYSFYVERQFARDREYQETVMTNHLRKVLLTKGVASFYRGELLGNEKYSVSVPFVYRKGEVAVRAIKPLDLNKDTSTKIYEHGDHWVNRIRRLREINCLPEDFLFAVRAPEFGSVTRAAAAREIELELTRLETRVVPFRDEATVVEFAKVA